LPVVSNASPLIWLARIGKLDLLKELFGEVVIPEVVYKEAVERGLQEGFGDALVIKESVDQGWVKTSTLTGKEVVLCQRIAEHAFEIHLGEAQAIVIARRTKGLLLMDESGGRTLAVAWGLKVRGTIYVIMKALREGMLSKDEARETLLQLVSRGFRVEPSLLARMLAEIDRFTSLRE